MPGNYTSHVDVGDATNCVVSGLTDGVTYYFTATAYDGDGNESDYSTAVDYTVPQATAPVQEPAAAAPASGGGAVSSPRPPSAATMHRRSSWLQKFRIEFACQ